MYSESDRSSSFAARLRAFSSGSGSHTRMDSVFLPPGIDAMSQRLTTEEKAAQVLDGKARGDLADEGEASIPEASRGSLLPTAENPRVEGFQPCSYWIALFLAARQIGNGVSPDSALPSSQIGVVDLANVGLSPDAAAGLLDAGRLRHVGEPPQNDAALSYSNWACYRTNWSHKCAVG
jgi:hypothetical protein